MRIFVSEYVSGGAWPDGAPPGSLAREGRAMLDAVLADLSRIDECHVFTTWDARLDAQCAPSRLGERVEIARASYPAEEHSLFTRLVKECDATLVIAPEFDGILAGRSQLVVDCGARLLGPTPDAVELCADKLALATHFQRHSIPTISMEPMRVDEISKVVRDIDLPIVIKPRDGAGSLDVSQISNRRQLTEWVAENRESMANRAMVWQPHIAGVPLSVSAIVAPDQERIDVLPVGEQVLSDDGRFLYRGGRIPFDDVDAEGVRNMITRTIRTIPGLHGYVGFDLIQPRDRIGDVVICEINPRLTTSYLGYRRLTDENLAERMLFDQRRWQPILWKSGQVAFTPND